MHTGYIKHRWSDRYVSFTWYSHASHYINTDTERERERERESLNFKSPETDRCKVNHLL